MIKLSHYGVIKNHLDTDDDTVMLITDPRHSDLNIHYLIGTEQNCDDYLNHNHITEQPIEVWQSYRIGHGLIDDEYQHHDFLPQHLHYDRLNAINWHKGCYVGQEICARIYFKGKVKRKIFPVKFATSDDEIVANADIVNDKQKSVGKIINVAPDDDSMDWRF